jgi:DNA-binding NarL/FixJ family response regulator
LAKTHSGPIDLLLTDVVMPRMNGHDLGVMLKSRRLGLKVVYISGCDRDAVVRHAVLDPERHRTSKSRSCLRQWLRLCAECWMVSRSRV